ncbi:MAG TPA: glycosyltransferase family 2 protein [Gemmatimonadaceae bacterium]|nr:glycosyltransferase family 2 protein [Gemmatimonadaceae bacterium]
MTAFPIEFEYPAEPGLVSVVIPTFNRARILRRAIDSALAQSYERLEVIVVDDGSTDETPDVLRDLGPRVRAIRQTNAGPAVARNTAIAHARGELVAFLDSDDTWLEWKIEAQVQALGRVPQAGLAWTDMIAVDDTGDVRSHRYLREMYGAYQLIDFPTLMRQSSPVADVRKNLADSSVVAPILVGDLSVAILYGNLLHTPTVLIRRSWIGRSGGFDPSYRHGGEDYEFYSRVCALGPVALIDAAAVRYRVGASDQLTAPEQLVHLAYNDLRTVRARTADPQRRRAMPAADLRRRLAECHAWVGSAELDHGRTWFAIKHLLASLCYRPRLDRRALRLTRCFIPDRYVRALRGGRRPKGSVTS